MKHEGTKHSHITMRKGTNNTRSIKNQISLVHRAIFQECENSKPVIPIESFKVCHLLLIILYKSDLTLQFEK